MPVSGQINPKKAPSARTACDQKKLYRGIDSTICKQDQFPVIYAFSSPNRNESMVPKKVPKAVLPPSGGHKGTRWFGFGWA